MKKISGEKQAGNKLIIASVIIMVLIVVIGAVFIYTPFSHKNKSLRIDILRERDRNVLIGKIKALSKYIKIYDKRIPDAEGVSWLLSEVSGLASKEHIEISSIKPGNPEDFGLLMKLSVVVDIASDYNQLGRFISRIESSEKFLRVESADIKRMDLDEKFEKGSGRFKAFDIRANIVISTIITKE